jgi:hypothetical protein
MVDFEHLAGIMAEMKARMNTNQEKREAILEWMKTEVDANQEEMKANQEKIVAKIKAYLEKRKANQEKLEVDQEKIEDVTEHYKGAPKCHLLTALHGQASNALHGDPKGVTYERLLGYLSTELGTSTWKQGTAIN